MATANILIRNPYPRNNSSSIPLDTIFTWDLIPFEGAILDMSTLTIKVTITGGTTNATEVHNYTSTSTEFSTESGGSTTIGYSCKLDLFPSYDINFDESQSITIKINIDDTLGNSMRETTLSYTTVRRDQLDALKDLLSELTEIHVYRENGRIDSAGTTVQYTYPNWNSDFTPTIYKNGVILTTGYTVNKSNGYLTFSSALRHHEIFDSIEADYRFSVFTDKELINFMYIGLAYFNAMRRTTSYTLNTASAGAQAAILYGGAYNAINFILISMLNQQFRVKWGDEWKELSSTLASLRDIYKAAIDKIAEEKKYRLAGTSAISVPEYSLPGGRSRFFRYLYKEGGNM